MHSLQQFDIHHVENTLAKWWQGYREYGFEMGGECCQLVMPLPRGDIITEIRRAKERIRWLRRCRRWPSLIFMGIATGPEIHVIVVIPDHIAVAELKDGVRRWGAKVQPVSVEPPQMNLTRDDCVALAGMRGTEKLRFFIGKALPRKPPIESMKPRMTMEPMAVAFYSRGF